MRYVYKFDSFYFSIFVITITSLEFGTPFKCLFVMLWVSNDFSYHAHCIRVAEIVSCIDMEMLSFGRNVRHLLYWTVRRLRKQCPNNDVMSK